MKSYTINHADKVILCTKKFYEGATQFGTPECDECQQLREAFPDYGIILREIKSNENKRVPNKNLTYANMVRYIVSQPNGAERLVEFAKIRNLSGQKGRAYSAVKHWFMERYPAFLIPGVSEQEQTGAERFISLEDARQMLVEFANCDTVGDIQDVVSTYLPESVSALALEEAS